MARIQYIALVFSIYTGAAVALSLATVLSPKPAGEIIVGGLIGAYLLMRIRILPSRYINEALVGFLAAGGAQYAAAQGDGIGVSLMLGLGSTWAFFFLWRMWRLYESPET